MKNKFENGRNKPKKTIEHTDDDSIEIDENAEQKIKLELTKQIEEFEKLDRLADESNLIWEAEERISKLQNLFDSIIFGKSIATDKSIDADGGVDETTISGEPTQIQEQLQQQQQSGPRPAKLERTPTESERKSAIREFISKILQQLSIVALSSSVSTGVTGADIESKLTEVSQQVSLDCPAEKTRIREGNGGSLTILKQQHCVVDREISIETAVSQSIINACKVKLIKYNHSIGKSTNFIDERFMQNPPATKTGRQFVQILSDLSCLPVSEFTPEELAEYKDLAGTVEISGLSNNLQTIRHFRPEETNILLEIFKTGILVQLPDGTYLSGSAEMDTFINSWPDNQPIEFTSKGRPVFKKELIARFVAKGLVKLLQEIEVEYNLNSDTTAHPKYPIAVMNNNQNGEMPLVPFSIDSDLLAAIGYKSKEEMYKTFQKIEVKMVKLLDKLLDKNGNLKPRKKRKFDVLYISYLTLNITQKYKFVIDARDNVNVKRLIDEYNNDPDASHITTIGSLHNYLNDWVIANEEGILPEGLNIGKFETAPPYMATNLDDGSDGSDGSDDSVSESSSSSESSPVTKSSPVNEPPHVINVFNTEGGLMKILDNEDVFLMMKVRNPFNGKLESRGILIDEDLRKALRKDKTFKEVARHSLIETGEYDAILTNFPKIKDALGADVEYFYRSIILAKKTGHAHNIINNKESILKILDTDKDISPDMAEKILKLIDEAQEIVDRFDSRKTDKEKPARVDSSKQNSSSPTDTLLDRHIAPNV